MRTRNALLALTATAAVVLIVVLVSGGGGEEQTPAEQGAAVREASAREASARERERIAEHNARVLEEYRDRQEAAEPTEEEVEARQAATEAYEQIESVAGAGFVDPSGDLRAGLQAAEGDGRLEALCDRLGEAAREQTVAYVRRSAGLADVEWTCEKAMALLIRRSNQASGSGRLRNVTVIGVNAVGDRATATVRVGRDARVSSIPLIRENGEWRLGSAPGQGGSG